MTKSIAAMREEYEAKIDSLMSGLATAREVQLARSGDHGGEPSSRALTRTTDSTRSSTYSLQEPRSVYRSIKDSSAGDSKDSTFTGDNTFCNTMIDENKPYSQRRRSAGVQSTYTASNTTVANRSLGGKKELAVDLENMTITSDLSFDNDSGSKINRPSASSSLRDLSKYASGRARSTGRSRNMSSIHEDDKNSTRTPQKPAPASRASKGADSKRSNLDLARTFLNGSSGNSVSSQTRSRSRSRPPQDRETFDNSDSKSIAHSVGGASIYNDPRSKSKGFGGNYDGDLNSRGERHGYGVFVADNGNEYEGEWKNDKREGHGKAKYNTGDVYIGNWKNCKRHGHGTMYIENGDAYEGGWNNGFKDGPGTYRWRDGEADISRYSQDYRTGEGVRLSEDRKYAFRLVRGNVQEEIDLREADRIAKSLGLAPP